MRILFKNEKMGRISIGDSSNSLTVGKIRLYPSTTRVKSHFQLEEPLAVGGGNLHPTTGLGFGKVGW